MEASMLEAERYELFEGPAYRFALERRDFFKLLGGGLGFLLMCDDPASAQESGRGRARSGEALPQTIGGWLHIGEDGAVTAYTGKVEMGQNIRTSLAQAVAEELHAPIASINLVMGDTDLTPFDMGTFGSRTTPTMAPQLKKVGAAARETLIDLAAEKWKVDRASVSVIDGKVKNSATAESIGFGALTHGQQLLKTVDGAAVTSADKWTVAGTSVPKTTARDIVTGAHRFTSAIVRPNMRVGRVLRPTAFNAKLVSLDTKQMDVSDGAPTAISVVHDHDFVGLVASNELVAGKAIAAIKAEWKADPQPSSKELFTYLKSHVESRGAGGRPAAGQGNIEQALQSSAHKLDASYTVAYIAHVPLEPRSAVAES